MGAPASLKFRGGTVPNATIFNNSVKFDTLFRPSTQLTTLSGNTNVRSYLNNYFDANGTDRTAQLTQAGTIGETYYVRNIGYANNVTLLDSSAAKMDTLYPGQDGTYTWDGANWQATNLTNPLAYGDLKLWVRADAGTFTSTLINSATTTDATTILSWQDFSSYGNYLTTGTTALLKNNIVNGLPVLRFNGTSQYFQTLNNVGFSSEFSVFAVCSRSVWTSSSSAHGLFGHTANAGGTSGYGLFHGSSAQEWGNNVFSCFGFGSNSARGPRSLTSVFTPANASFHVLSSICGTNADFWADGTRINSTSTGCAIEPVASGTGVLLLAKNSNSGVGSACLWDGDIAEFLIYAGNIGYRNKLRIERYLGKKYGITVQ